MAGPAWRGRFFVPFSRLCRAWSDGNGTSVIFARSFTGASVPICIGIFPKGEPTLDRVVGTVPDPSDQFSQSLADAFGPAGLEAAEFNLPEWPFDLLPAAVYVCDREGAILKFNNLAAELWGRQPSTGSSGERFCGSTRLYRPDGTPLPHEQCPMAVALRTGTPVRDEEVVIERADGSRGFALVNINVLKDDAGQVLGAVNCFLDITGRKHAEQAEQKARAQVERLSEELRSERDELRESERRYHALIDALPAAVYTTDAAGRLTYYNEALTSGAAGRKLARASSAAHGSSIGPMALRCRMINAPWRWR